MWLVLEYVDGVSLAEVLAKSERLSLHGALAIGVEIAKALAHAHERGIIHRDIKPANVLVSRRGEIKLVDFGIAHDDRVPSSPEPLEGGSTFGTPAYMSPEQILGEPLDARTDIFSLGIVLYQLVAGVRPFDGPDTKTTAHRIRHSEPRSLVSSAPDPAGRSSASSCAASKSCPAIASRRAREAGVVARSASSLGDDELRPRSSITSRARCARSSSPSRRRHRRSTQQSLVLDPSRAPLWPAVRGFFGLLLARGRGGRRHPDGSGQGRSRRQRQEGAARARAGSHGVLARRRSPVGRGRRRRAAHRRDAVRSPHSSCRRARTT